MKAPNADQVNRYRWSDRIDARLPGRMIRSQAFIELTNTAKLVLILFLHRRKWHIEGKGRKRRTVYNNRGLMFSYTEAEELWGINRRTFRDCIVQLIKHGFLQVEKQGGTLQGNRVISLYMMVPYWENYGTLQFIEPTMPMIPNNDSLKRFNESRRNNSRVSLTSPDR